MLKLVETPPFTRTPLASAPFAPTPPRNYVEVLGGELDDRLFRRKGDRTRARLRVAAAAAMSEAGFEPPRIADIAALTRTSTATFYVYYRDLADCAGEVLGGFADWLFGDRPRARDGDIEDLVEALIGRACANLMLVRALDRGMEALPSLAERVRASRRRWVRAMIGQLRPGRETPDAAPVDALVAGLLREISVCGRAGAEAPRLAAAIGQILRAGTPTLTPAA